MSAASAASQSSRVVHWPTGSGGWQTALTQFAKIQNPSKTSLPPGVYLRSDSNTLTIFDGYPKAKFHFLILPRIPFVLNDSQKQQQQFSSQPSTSAPPSSKPELGLVGGKLAFGASNKAGTVPASHLQSLSSLLASPYAQDVLTKLRIQSEAVVQLIKEEMRQMPLPSQHSQQQSSKDKCEVEWGIKLGFHAVPSMDTVHLHVISDDLVSERLKHKKHYQSFKPNHGFWLDLDFVEDLVKKGKKVLPKSVQQYESLLKLPLVSFRDGKEYPNMPKLKEHLEQAWIQDIHQRRRNDSRINKKHTIEQDEQTSSQSKVIKT